MIDKNPLVTVLLPCYNAELYIEEAVRSIMTQTYSNLEILIIDDCSTDSSLDILTKLSLEDDRIRLIRNEQNLRLIRTLNKGILLSQGEYIARMDADDISLPNRIDLQVKFMLNNLDIGICGTNIYVINSIGEKEVWRINYLEDNESICAERIFRNPFAHPTVIFRKKLICEVGGYDERMTNIEDYELWNRLLSITKGANLIEKLVKYRRHENNITILNKDKKINSINLALSLSSKYDGFIEEYIDIQTLFFIDGWNSASIDDINKLLKWKIDLISYYRKDKRVLLDIYKYYYTFAILKMLRYSDLNVKILILTKFIFMEPVALLVLLSEQFNLYVNKLFYKIKRW